MSARHVIPGPGTVRVGQFIGRLGVVSLPAVEIGLHLDQRVVRRHVAKLEAAGSDSRAVGLGRGIGGLAHGDRRRCTGLGGLRAVNSPPAPTTIAHGVLVGWTAARVERRRRTWKSARELAVDRERWAVRMRCERGYTDQLPDLAVWIKSDGPPVAVIVETGGRREDRQKMILEGWRDAIASGHYARVHYDCVNGSVARWISRLAKNVWLSAPDFFAQEQLRADEIATLSPAADDGAPHSVTEAQPPAPPDVPILRAPIRASGTSAPEQLENPEPPPRPDPDTAEAAAERERLVRELLGIDEPRSRRRWRR